MRRFALATVALLSLAACSQDSTSPTGASDFDAAGAFGTALTVAGGYEAGLYESRLANGLPDDLKLSAEQRAKIKALVKAFEDATRADREALRAILKDAAGAGRKGTREDAKRILDRVADVRTRLGSAETGLKADIDAVLTPEQRAWIASHSPKRCDPSKFVPLTDAQRTQIRALEAAFEVSHKADLDIVKAAYDEIKAAVGAGKSKEQLAGILEPLQPAIARLATGRITLHGQIMAVLTAEQRASGCLPLG